MKIYSFQQQGQRPYQEDSLYLDPEQHFYIVCDGVGGHTAGKTASELVAQAFAKKLSALQGECPSDEELQQMTDHAHQLLLDRIAQAPELSGMATTLALVYFYETGVLTAHIGDSRVYHLTTGEADLWHTKDHSFVQELFDAGILKSEAEMEAHPKRNVITRALTAKPGSKPPFIAINHLKDKSVGDTFLICSDGVLEPFSREGLLQIFRDTTQSLEQKAEMIKMACREESRDNNTAILLQLQPADVLAPGSAQALPAMADKTLPPPRKSTRGKRFRLAVLLFVLVFMLVAIIYQLQTKQTVTDKPLPARPEAIIKDNRGQSSEVGRNQTRPAPTTPAPASPLDSSIEEQLRRTEENLDALRHPIESKPDTSTNN